jgi:predicted outer membrane protein
MAKTTATVEPQKTGKKSFAFRLPQDAEAAAMALAESEGMSVGELAKELLLDHLKQASTPAVPVSLLNAKSTSAKDMLAEIELLRANLRFATFAILVECGNADPDEVEGVLSAHWQ